MVFSSQNKKQKKATGNGYYVIGTTHFKIRKGKPLPEHYDEVFYQEPEPVKTAGDVFVRRLTEHGYHRVKVEQESEEGDEVAVDEDSAEEAVDADGAENAVEEDGAEVAVEADSADEQASPPAKKARGKRS